MTVMSDMYDELRDGGLSQKQAVRLLATQLNVDDRTVVRTLTRAGALAPAQPTTER